MLKNCIKIELPDMISKSLKNERSDLKKQKKKEKKNRIHERQLADFELLYSYLFKSVLFIFVFFFIFLVKTLIPPYPKDVIDVEFVVNFEIHNS